MQLDDALPQLEQLSDTDADAAIAAARTERVFRLQYAGVFVALAVAIGVFSLAVPRVYQAFHPPLYFRLVFGIAALTGIWQAVKLVQRVLEHFYSRAISRQISMRVGAP